jgi:predicted amidophosphoribosyltransferase
LQDSTQSGSIVSTIPVQLNSNRLAPNIAKHISFHKGVKLIQPQLLVSKPKIKQLNLKKKVIEWRKIYQNNNPIDIDDKIVKKQDVVIIDDLYQSGITMWSYAKFLKKLGAKRVFGLVCVKTMRNSDNQ